MYPQQIIDALNQVRYPGTGKTIIESGMLEDDIRIEGLKVSFSLIFHKQNDPFEKSLVKAAEAAIKTYVDKNCTVVINTKHPAAVVAKDDAEQGINHFGKIIAVASGKGGVGKSTVTANLAIALTQRGKKVGLLDADIHGPSQPMMFNVEQARPVASNINGKDYIEPIEQYGVKLLSIGFFVDSDSAIVWRGGMASNALRQLIEEAHWGNLDYFLIDLPPGTSDIHLTLIQTLNLDGAIIVTTPQAVALTDAVKGIDMFQNDKINVPILGIVENMAWFTPKELPQNKYYVFGKEGGKQLAERLGITLLGQVPLVQSIRESGDEGMPVAMQEGHPAAQLFREIAQKIIEKN